MKTYVYIALLSLSSMIQGISMEPFSLQELQVLGNFPVQKPAFIKASDGIQLAYYSFVPPNPRAMVIFYHGAGFYSSALYQNFAKQLADDYGIGCYLFDIRGHGNSEGKRGDAPSVNQVWDDVTTAIDFVSKQYSGIPLYLGGHSSGGGLVLNYSNYHHHSAVKGYLFVAPYLGRNSGAIKEHVDANSSFVKHVRVWTFMLNRITWGYFFGHTPAVFFNYSEELLKTDNRIVTSYTVTMMAATSPENPKELFKKLDKPFALLAAEKDEQFIASKIIAYKNCAAADLVQDSIAEIILNAKHLDILLSAATYCAQFINFKE